MRREDLNIVKDYNFEEGELFYRVERLNYTQVRWKCHQSAVWSQVQRI